MEKKKVLVVVAHPDDETIWMGGTLIRNKDKWETTIVSLCRASDKDRAPKFKKVCQELNAKSIILDLEDEKLNPIPINNIIKLLSRNINNYYDGIFTHGKNGEYGHPRHIEAHRAIIKMLEDKSLKAGKIFFFSYRKINADGTDTSFDSIADTNANKFINLNKLELLTKKFLIEQIYGFQKGGYEERNSRNTEAFNELK